LSKYTGTFQITLQGKEYTLRPSFEAMVEFEEKSGKAVNEAFMEMTEGKMSFKTIACAIWAGILGEAAYQNDKSLQKKFQVVGEMIKKDGLQNHVSSASTFFTMALIPEDEQKKLVEEETEGTKKNKE
jgi:hypothetical protein